MNHGHLVRKPDPAHPANKGIRSSLVLAPSNPSRRAPGPMPPDGGQPAAAAAAASAEPRPATGHKPMPSTSAPLGLIPAQIRR